MNDTNLSASSGPSLTSCAVTTANPSTGRSSSPSPSQEKRAKQGLNPQPFLLKAAGLAFYNTSPPPDLRTLMGDATHIAENLRSYIGGFSAHVRDIFERFEFHTRLTSLP